MDFLKNFAADRFPHAIALVGPLNAARDAAWELAGRQLCEAVVDGACGQCGPCLRIARRQSEGVLTVEPEKGVIKLEAATRIAEFLGLKRITRARVVIIEEAQSLNIQTTNAILKLVEEPPEAAYFFILVSDLSALLPTLRSRLQVVRLPVSTRAALPEVAEGLSSAAAFMVGCLRRERGAVAAWLETVEDRAASERACQALQRVLRDWCVGSESAALDGGADFSSWPNLSAAARTRLWGEAFQIEQDLKAHADRTLVFENFFYQVGHELD